MANGKGCVILLALETWPNDSNLFCILCVTFFKIMKLCNVMSANHLLWSWKVCVCGGEGRCRQVSGEVKRHKSVLVSFLVEERLFCFLGLLEFEVNPFPFPPLDQWFYWQPGFHYVISFAYLRWEIRHEVTFDTCKILNTLYSVSHHEWMEVLGVTSRNVAKVP